MIEVVQCRHHHYYLYYLGQLSGLLFVLLQLQLGKCVPTVSRAVTCTSGYIRLHYVTVTCKCGHSVITVSRVCCEACSLYLRGKWLRFCLHVPHFICTRCGFVGRSSRGRQLAINTLSPTMENGVAYSESDGRPSAGRDNLKRYSNGFTSASDMVALQRHDEASVLPLLGGDLRPSTYDQIISLYISRYRGGSAFSVKLTVRCGPKTSSSDQSSRYRT